MIVAHANYLARPELLQLLRSSVEHGLVSSLSLLELWPWINDLRLQMCREIGIFELSVYHRAIVARGAKKLYYIYALISNVSIIILSRPSTQFYLFIDVAFLLY